jgi:hypothetical protein
MCLKHWFLDSRPCLDFESRYAAKFSKSTAAYKLDSVKYSAAKVSSGLRSGPPRISRCQ